MTVVELIAQPLAVPAALVGGLLLGVVMTWPIAHSSGQASAHNDELNRLSERREKYLRANLTPPKAS